MAPEAGAGECGELTRGRSRGRDIAQRAAFDPPARRVTGGNIMASSPSRGPQSEPERIIYELRILPLYIVLILMHKEE